jgi:histidine decarboxylase
MQRYDLAPEEDPSFGKVAHLIVMPHVSKVLDQFVGDMQEWKASESLVSAP